MESQESEGEGMKQAERKSFAAYARKIIEAACDADACLSDQRAAAIRSEATAYGLQMLAKFTKEEEPA